MDKDIHHEIKTLISNLNNRTDSQNVSALYLFAYFSGGKGMESSWLFQKMNLEQRLQIKVVAVRLLASFEDFITSFQCIDSARFSPVEMEGMLPDVPRAFVEELTLWES